jgi:hypothetical protein
VVAFKDAIWPRAAFYAQEAVLGYRHTLGQPGAGKGGVRMWIGPALQHLAANLGHSNCGWA